MALHDRTDATKTRATVRLEQLEAREVPAIAFVFDYSRDASGFFNNPEARAALERAGSDLGGTLAGGLAAIAPGGGNAWSATFFDPATGGSTSAPNLSVGADTLYVYVGARNLPGTEAGYGGYGGYSVSGSQGWNNLVASRGRGGFAPWGGSITFDTNSPWHLGTSTVGLDPNELDFYSVAVHELGHVLGIGTAPQWTNLVRGNTFQGANAVGVFGGPVPVQSGGGHWANGVTLNGQPVSLDPSLGYGTRAGWTALDAAALRDIGWGAAVPAPTPQNNFAPIAAGQNPVAFTGNTDGTVSLFVVSGGVLADTGRRLTPFVGYRGAIRVASGDFDGDGVTDYAFTTGAGPQSVVQIMSGRDGSLLVGQTAVFPGFRGGLFLAAADIDRDGRAELAISADAGAGPHIQTFRVVGGQLVVQSSFFAFDNPAYRGGARVAAGDLDRDGYADLVVTTGGQAEGRVAVYSGADLRNGVPTRLTPDFIPFAGMWGAVNAAVGDMDGDGFAELAVTPERGPAHVKVWSGHTLTTNPGAQASALPLTASFMAFDPADPSGARLALRDTDGDGRAELVAASANPRNAVARVFSLGQMQAGGGGAPFAVPFGTTTSFDGLYAGLLADPRPDGASAPVVTSTLDPMAGKCHCAGCSILARLGEGESVADALPFAAPVG